MDSDRRPVSDIINEIKSYNGKKKTTERLEDLEMLSKELGQGFDVKYWTFNKHLRVAIIADDGYQR